MPLATVAGTRTLRSQRASSRARSSPAPSTRPFRRHHGKAGLGPRRARFPWDREGPQELLEALQGIGEMTSNIKVHDLETFETKVKDGKVLIKVK